MSANNIIGNGTSQIVMAEGDCAFFRAVTLSHPVILGHRTYRSIGRVLRGRHIIVVAKSAVDIPCMLPEFTSVTAVRSIGKACSLARELDKTVAFVAGGGQVYAQTMDLVDELLIMRVPRLASGTVHYPDIDPQVWRLIRVQTIFEATVNHYARK